MIKKLMIVMLVLGLVSLANALTGVQLSVEGQTDGVGNVTEVEVPISSEVVIDIHGPAAYDWLGYVIIEGDYPTLAGGEWGDDIGEPGGGYYAAADYPKLVAAGDLGQVLRYDEDGWGYGYEVTAAQSEGDLPGGEQFQFLYHCTGPESEYVTITLWDDAEGYETPQDTIVIHQVPEPVTMALFGIGGLLLRRRRK